MLPVERVRERFPESLLEVTEYRGETTIRVRREDILEVLRFLKEDEACAFDFLTDLTGVDNMPARPRFQVVYLLYSFRSNQRLRIKVDVPEEQIHVASATPLWKGANWLERETYDMFGIIFDGHPDLSRILMWHGFDGHPLRKDFPLKERDKSIAPPGA